MSTKKRKQRKDDDEPEWTPKQKRRVSQNLTCILHSSEVSTPGNFTSLKLCKPSADEKFSELCKIKGRRQNEKADSPYRMYRSMLKIPDSIIRIDPDTTGWHRGCYQ